MNRESGPAGQLRSVVVLDNGQRVTVCVNPANATEAGVVDAVTAAVARWTPPPPRNV